MRITLRNMIFRLLYPEILVFQCGAAISEHIMGSSTGRARPARRRSTAGGSVFRNSLWSGSQWSIPFQYGHFCCEMDSYAKRDEETPELLYSDAAARAIRDEVLIFLFFSLIFLFRAFKHTSAQRFDLIHRLLPKLKQQSEDCLFMNLFVPERLGEHFIFVYF